MDKFKEYCNNATDAIIAITKFLIVLIILILLLFSINYLIKDTKVDIDTKINKIESKNDSIKTKVKNLDSIKNAKANEVQYLNNDSTIELFYKIIKSK